MGQIKQLSISGLLVGSENVFGLDVEIDSTWRRGYRKSSEVVRIGGILRGQGSRHRADCRTNSVDIVTPHSVIQTAVCPGAAIPVSVVSVSGRGGSGHDVLEILGILKTVGPAYAVRALRGTAG